MLFVKRKSKLLHVAFVNGNLKDISNNDKVSISFYYHEDWSKGSFCPWEDLLNKGDLEGVWCYIPSKSLDVSITNCSVQYVTKVHKGMPNISVNEYTTSLNNTYEQAIPVLCETLNKELLNHPSFSRASIQQHNKL